MFRILYFKLHRHKILEEIEFRLTNMEESLAPNYYSIIIGPNGTGKSFLLKAIIEAFNEIVIFKIYKAKPKFQFEIEYQLNDKHYKIDVLRDLMKISKNGKRIDISDLELPEKWLASSVTINDKYPVLTTNRKNQIPNYHYLGIRSASNNAFISRITLNTVNYLIEALKNGKANQLKEVYKSLSLNTKVQIIFSGGTMLKLKKKNGILSLYDSPEEIMQPFNSFLEKNANKISYRLDGYRKYIKDYSTFKKIYNYILAHGNSFIKDSKSSIQLKYDIDFDNYESIENLLSDWDLLSSMTELELIKINRFVLTKNTQFQFEEASSGESHLLSSLHGIIANLQNNSLLVIDEPEISLHPNWQIDYFEILKLLVDNFNGVSVIIATHSNLIVSSLKNEESRILSMKRVENGKKLEVKELDYETYGWDPENILYNIFNVANTRNKYFELDLRKLTSLISNKSENKNEIKRLVDKLNPFIMKNQEDPLSLLLNQANNYLKQ